MHHIIQMSQTLYLSFFHESFPSFWVCGPWSLSGLSAAVGAHGDHRCRGVPNGGARGLSYGGMGGLPSGGGGCSPVASWEPASSRLGPYPTAHRSLSVVDGRRCQLDHPSTFLPAFWPPQAPLPEVVKKGPGGAPRRRPRPEGRPPAAPTPIALLYTTKSNFQSAFFSTTFFSCILPENRIEALVSGFRQTTITPSECIPINVSSVKLSPSFIYLLFHMLLHNLVCKYICSTIW